MTEPETGTFKACPRLQHGKPIAAAIRATITPNKQ